MAIELVKALLTIVKACASTEDCQECPLREFCGKPFQSL